MSGVQSVLNHLRFARHWLAKAENEFQRAEALQGELSLSLVEAEVRKAWRESRRGLQLIPFPAAPRRELSRSRRLLALSGITLAALVLGGVGALLLFHQESPAVLRREALPGTVVRRADLDPMTAAVRPQPEAAVERKAPPAVRTAQTPPAAETAPVVQRTQSAPAVETAQTAENPQAAPAAAEKAPAPGPISPPEPVAAPVAAVDRLAPENLPAANLPAEIAELPVRAPEPVVAAQRPDAVSAPAPPPPTATSERPAATVPAGAVKPSPTPAIAQEGGGTPLPLDLVELVRIAEQSLTGRP